MKRKGLTITIILFLLTLTFTSSINANMSRTSFEQNFKKEVLEKHSPTIEVELKRIMNLIKDLDLRKIIINPEIFFNILGEISYILEENEDIINYIEKSSDEDCDCREDSSEFEWFFPVICTLLVPFWTVAFLLALFFGYPFGEIMMSIGVSLNCYWTGY